MVDLEPATAPSKTIVTVPWKPIPIPSPLQPYCTEVGHKAKQNKSNWHQCHMVLSSTCQHMITLRWQPATNMRSSHPTMLHTALMTKRKENIYTTDINLLLLMSRKSYSVWSSNLQPFLETKMTPATIALNPTAHSTQHTPTIPIMPPRNHIWPTVTTNPHTNIFTDSYANFMVQASAFLMRWPSLKIVSILASNPVILTYSPNP